MLLRPGYLQSMKASAGGVSIEETITRAKAGDEAATRALATAFLPLLRREAGRVVPAQLVEDALSEATIALYKALRAYDPGRNRPFSAYLRATVRSTLAAWFAEERSWHMSACTLYSPAGADDTEDLTLHDVLAYPDAVDPEDAAQVAEVVELLETLPHTERDTIRRHVHDESLHDIAAARGASREAARQQWARGIGRLQTALGVAS